MNSSYEDDRQRSADREAALLDKAVPLGFLLYKLGPSPQITGEDPYIVIDLTWLKDELYWISPMTLTEAEQYIAENTRASGVAADPNSSCGSKHHLPW